MILEIFWFKQWQIPAIWFQHLEPSLLRSTDLRCILALIPFLRIRELVFSQTFPWSWQNGRACLHIISTAAAWVAAVLRKSNYIIFHDITTLQWQDSPSYLTNWSRSPCWLAAAGESGNHFFVIVKGETTVPWRVSQGQDLDGQGQPDLVGLFFPKNEDLGQRL